MYQDYYQLNKMPFSMSPDPSFFYASKGHKKALSYLKYGVAQGEGFIVITGDIGTGKTTVVKNLLMQLDPEKYIARQLVSTFLKEAELIESVCYAFGLESEDLSKAALLERLKKFLVQSHRQNKKVILIVDEAQNLPLKTVEELRMLSNYQIGNKPLLQSFLVGQKEFMNTLQSETMEQLRQRVIASSHLSSLLKNETKQYINYRLHQAGWNSEDIFSHKAYLMIHVLTEGVPRRINLLCDRILLYGYLEELRFFSEDQIKIVVRELAGEITSPIKKNLFAKKTSAKPNEKVSSVKSDSLGNDDFKSNKTINPFDKSLERTV